MRPPTLPRRSRALPGLGGLCGLLTLLLTTGCDESPQRLTAGDPIALAAVADARAALEAGDRGRALVVLEKAGERCPNSLELHRERAHLSASLNRLEPALEDYEAVLRSDPGDAEAARGMLQVGLFVGRRDLVELARGSLEALPDPCAETCALLAREALERGDVLAAERFGRRAVARAPEDAEAHFRLGQALLELAAASEARAAFEAAVAADPGHAGAQHALGTLLLQGGQEAVAGRAALARADAVRSLEAQAFGRAPAAVRRARALEACARHPEWSGGWIELGRAELELGDAEAAARALDRALAERPERPFAARLRARAAGALGRQEEAERFEQLAEERAAARAGR